ncbi:WD repeat-containing protein 47 [Trichonephila clavipes]|nr:WD repeat-containing protein 47 [Trichonephila clavipes]
MFAPCCGPPTSYYMWPHQQLPNLWTRPMPTVTSTLPTPTKPCPMHDSTHKRVHEKLQRACSAPKPLSGKKKVSGDVSLFDVKQHRRENSFCPFRVLPTFETVILKKRING